MAVRLHRHVYLLVQRVPHLQLVYIVWEHSGQWSKCSLEKILLIGDFLHVLITLWALGDRKWDVWSWSPLLWTTLLLGLTLLVPRAMWHLGIWRYVHTRDAGKINIAAGVPSDRGVSQVKTEWEMRGVKRRGNYCYYFFLFFSFICIRNNLLHCKREKMKEK